MNNKFSTPESQNVNFHEFIEKWKQAAPALEKIRAKELQSYTYDPELVDSLLELGLQHATPRTDSGLVEMQRYFRQWHTRAKLIP